MSNKCKNSNCNAWATSDGYCFLHSPNMKEKRVQAQRKGGSITKTPGDRVLVKLEPVNINTSRDVVSLLSETVNLVRAGQIDTKVANCIGSLSNYIIRAIEISELEGRLEEVERVIFEKRTIK